MRYLVILPSTEDFANNAERRLSRYGAVKLRLNSREIVAWADTDVNLIGDVKSGCLAIGTLFAKHGGAVAGFSAVEAEKITKSGGRHLIDEYWGSYTAFIKGRDASAFNVLRDPSGALPCYYMQADGNWLFASEADLLFTGAGKQPEVDWSFLSYHLYCGSLNTPRTGLIGINELLQGHRLHPGSEGPAVEQLWSPWDFVAPFTSYRNTSEIAKALKAEVTYAVTQLTSRFHHPLLSISGGLDSSAIAASLQGRSTAWSMLTVATSYAEGDERYYARAVADRFEKTLFQHVYDIGDVDIERPVTGHLPRPFGLLLGQNRNKAQLEVAEKIGADAHVSGLGGDGVFCYMQSATPLLDRYRVEGIGKGTWRTLNDICAVTDASLWQVLCMAMRRAKSGRARYKWKFHPELLNPDMVSGYDTVSDHPWLTPPDGTLPGKAVHVGMIFQTQTYMEGTLPLGSAPLITPLLSQPIIEFCLRIPTWQWCAGGRNRSPVRDAYAEDLPLSVLSRSTKGTPNGFFIEIIESNLQNVRNFLLGGILSQKKIVNVPCLERILSKDTYLQSLVYMRIGALIEAEAWARKWSSHGKS